MTFPCSRPSGMSTYAFRPAAAALAATLPARFPVEAQPTVWNPNSTAFESATATTRSLNESEGWLTASFLMYSSATPRPAPGGRPGSAGWRRRAGRRSARRRPARARGSATSCGGGPRRRSGSASGRRPGSRTRPPGDRSPPCRSSAAPWDNACRRADTSGPGPIHQSPASLRAGWPSRVPHPWEETPGAGRDHGAEGRPKPCVAFRARSSRRGVRDGREHGTGGRSGSDRTGGPARGRTRQAGGEQPGAIRRRPSYLSHRPPAA
jgi:hypothetical protein